MSPRWRRLLAVRARVLAVLAILGLLSPLLSHPLADAGGAASWLIDLGSHWQWLFLALLVLSSLLLAILDRRWAIVVLAAPLPWLTASPAAPSGERTAGMLVVASANIQYRNPDARALVEWLRKEKADLAIVLEVAPAHVRELEAVADYPHRRIVPDDGAFGIAVLSRHRLADVRVIEGAAGIPRIEAVVQLPRGQVRLTALHPMPPLTTEDHFARNRLLRALADAAAASSAPSIIAGDLNATPWSSAFAGLADRGLRRATGLAPTWPAAAAGLMGIPIDHVLVSQQWRTVASRAGPNLGSDHLPVLATLTLP
ncbi:MAG: endonuclease/exonuclease/phosphatase family protein [Betaproteobacteria bacterium]